MKKTRITLATIIMLLIICPAYAHDDPSFTAVFREVRKYMYATNTDPEIPFEYVAMQVLGDKQDVAITFSSPHHELPAIYSEFNGSIYSAVEASVAGIQETEFIKAVIFFSVEKSWISSIGSSQSAIALYRYDDRWTKLPTTINGTNATHAIYRAESPSLSYFLIGRDAYAIPNNAQSNNTNESQVIKSPDEVSIPPEDKSASGETNIQVAKKMDDSLLVKIIAAIFSVAAIIIVIVIVDRIARKRVMKMRDEMLRQSRRKEGIEKDKKRLRKGLR